MFASKKSRQAIKHMDRFSKEDFKFDGRSDDIIIPVMGPTGVGKSTFINAALLGNAAVRVGHGLESCTSSLVPVAIPFGSGPTPFLNPYPGMKGRLVLVDTPGFDDTYVDDVEILRRISVWLGTSYIKGMKLGGVVYLHDITQTRMLGTNRRNLDMFQKLVGRDALGSVVLGTTKWDLLNDPEIGAQRQTALEKNFWQDMIAANCEAARIDTLDAASALVVRILNSHSRKSASSGITLGTSQRFTAQANFNLNIRNSININIGASISSVTSNNHNVANDESFPDGLLAIQNEIVNLQKFIGETEAGQALKYTLYELMELQKRRRNDDKTLEIMARLEELAKELKVPLSDRLKRMFGL